ncbi:hypothetical protein PG996_002936 [Apiospora saccharicola]|uniref:Uncharacterized protein n=1 Tax=Apiospora saccharicola TaxID=335842 RepID=A0ABR1WNU3_9PEZI
MAHPESQPIGFLFINTAHPSEASTPRTLSRIRSHAAKENRARAAARITKRPGPVERIKGGRRQVGQVRSSQVIIINPREAQHQRQAQGGEDVGKRQRDVPLSRTKHIPFLPGAEPLWRPVRPLSAQETSLLDHYVNHIILFNKGRCHAAGNSAPPWFTSMQLQCWLPFALADPGLLATLLLQSCRSLESMNICSRPGSYYCASGAYLVYKQQCIRWVNKCVASEHQRANDSTIAIVTVLLAESYLLGNLEEWQVHLAAHARMLELRGGVDALGLDGFLKGVIEK